MGMLKYQILITIGLLYISYSQAQVGVNLNANQYIRYSFDAQSGPNATDEENIYIGFSTQQRSGILMQITNDNKDKREYISIELNNYGGVKVEFDVGWGREVMNTQPAGVNLANGQQHVAHVWRVNKGRQVHIKVDDYPEAVQHWPLPDMIDTRLDNPKYIYLGNNNTSDSLKGFHGCLYRAQFDNIFPLKHVFQDPRPGFIYVSHDNEIKKGTCGSEETTLQPEPNTTTITKHLEKGVQILLGVILPVVFVLMFGITFLAIRQFTA